MPNMQIAYTKPAVDPRRMAIAQGVQNAGSSISDALTRHAMMKENRSLQESEQASREKIYSDRNAMTERLAQEDAKYQSMKDRSTDANTAIKAISVAEPSQRGMLYDFFDKTFQGRHGQSLRDYAGANADDFMPSQAENINNDVNLFFTDNMWRAPDNSEDKDGYEYRVISNQFNKLVKEYGPERAEYIAFKMAKIFSNHKDLELNLLSSLEKQSANPASAQPNNNQTGNLGSALAKGKSMFPSQPPEGTVIGGAMGGQAQQGPSMPGLNEIAAIGRQGLRDSAVPGADEVPSWYTRLMEDKTLPPKLKKGAETMRSNGWPWEKVLQEIMQIYPQVTSPDTPSASYLSGSTRLEGPFSP